MLLADTRSTRSRLCAAYRLTADLLANFGIDQSQGIISNGRLNPDGAGIEHDQMIYQHGRYRSLDDPFGLVMAGLAVQA
jgi:hypothetical protein